MLALLDNGIEVTALHILFFWDDPHVYFMHVHGMFFFFNDTAPTEIYTLSLHDALPFSCRRGPAVPRTPECRTTPSRRSARAACPRSEEHTSELQSRLHLVCRLLLEKKKQKEKQLSIHTKKNKQK